MLDFGKMGKWSEETLMDKVIYYCNFQGIPVINYGELMDIYKSKTKCIIYWKKLRKMTVGDMLIEMDNYNYNKSLDEDWDKLQDVVLRLCKKIHIDKVNVS